MTGEINGLFYRQIGQGQPILILHGGPDFDHTYLLPELDRLSDAYRLIYYDQRGRGKSAENIQPEEVSLASDIEDIDRLRGFFQLNTAAVLGHSFGGLLALEYALAHPQRVSHLILAHPAPASRDDYLHYREQRRKNTPADLEQMRALASTPAYRGCDPEAVAVYYRVHFQSALSGPEHLVRLVDRLRASFTQEGIRKARAIEGRLMLETWLSSHYDLLPRLKALTIPTLVIHGDHDFIPIECSLHIAQAIPEARFVLLKDCGHFSYMECSDEFRQAIDGFFQGR
jgi:proline iminopeptidase